MMLSQTDESFSPRLRPSRRRAEHRQPRRRTARCGPISTNSCAERGNSIRHPGYLSGLVCSRAKCAAWRMSSRRRLGAANGRRRGRRDGGWSYFWRAGRGFCELRQRGDLEWHRILDPGPDSEMRKALVYSNRSAVIRSCRAARWAG